MIVCDGCKKQGNLRVIKNKKYCKDCQAEAFQKAGFRDSNPAKKSSRVIG